MLETASETATQKGERSQDALEETGVCRRKTDRSKREESIIASQKNTLLFLKSHRLRWHDVHLTC